MSDLYGIIKIKDLAFHFEVEVKTGKAVLNPKQKVWSSFCERMGVPFCVARSVEDVEKMILELTEKVNATTNSEPIL